MPETLALLFFAHVLADYVLQTRRMVETKDKGATLALHFLIVLGSLLLIFGQWDAPALYLLALSHIFIDTIKVQLFDDRFRAHILDQIAHIATLLITAALAPTLWADAPLAPLTWLPESALLLAGLLYATRAGGFAVGKLMEPFSPELTRQSLPGGGQMIGILERGLIFGLMIAGLPAGIGFLIAAKSVLRFETIQSGGEDDSRQMAEYVIIGTLASFAWALAVSMGTLALLHSLLGLPLLEIIRPSA
ncbi:MULTISPECIES: DUF3307 domain-containing protein [Roseovarius]|jgi:hypothetical protein|uniref:DUF3307 domain-containing protein n=1 Tax=Roseovarius TaxID=74030 RepID=UPI001C08847A|nr:DUF3307 domain-containing protein [Roseovarius nubinhibens]MBU3001508.1 DUF3307 domain-containing protein [Roseovarius nubinhibens]